VYAVLGAAEAQGAHPSLLKFSGSISGQVKSAAGVTQMGAAVILYNRYDRILRHVITDPQGKFSFDALMPDLYSVRVSLNSFVPAFKRNIAVQPGIQSLLTINLAGILSSIEVVSTVPANGSLMTPEWKWILRSAQSTRPILRFQDEVRKREAHVFSETRGIVKVSAGDGTTFASSTAQPDLGTAFALATSLFGSNQLQVSGNVGHSAHAGLPTAGFRTTYSRREGIGAGPQLTVTMRQISLPVRSGLTPGVGDGPALRTIAISTIDEFTVLDAIRFEYGMSAESVSLVNRLNTLSPFARLTYDLGSAGAIQIAFSSGANAIELASRGTEPGARPRENAELHQDLTALGALPRVSMRDGQLKVQRTDNLELGYRKVAGSRTYSAGVYRERVTNGALTMAGSDNIFEDNLLPDMGSRSSIFNIGNYNRWGYLASMSQSFTEKLEVSVAYGSGGALTADRRTVKANDPDELRSLIGIANRKWASARVSGTAPVLGTHFAATYGWADYRSLMPAHHYLTQRVRPDPGLNVSIRQPVPTFGLVPGRLEANAELRNLLEQGYLPFSSADGKQLILTNSPRAVRGSLSFIF